MMKRIGQIIVILTLAVLIPSGFAFGQEKKDEKQIKVIVTDKGGEKVIIDTTIVGSDASGKIVKVVKGEPIMIITDDGGEKVVVHATGSQVHAGSGEKVMTWSHASPGEHGNVVYITKSDNEIKDGEVKYNIEVRTDESGNKTEKTSYVIAKDGMVVTIEGGSEEKVKEIASVVEAKLGVSKDDKSKKEVKEETKKTTTKK